MLTRTIEKMGDYKKTWLFGRFRSLILFPGLTLVSMCLSSACSPIATPSPVTSTSTSTPTRTLTPSPLPPTATPLPPTATPPIPTPTESCLSMPGQLVKGVVDTDLLDQPMTYIVYLPPCYGQEPSRHYPVLYLLHGQDNHEDQWVRLGVPTTADKLIAAGALPPFIIVFPHDPSHQPPYAYHFEDVFIQLLIPQIDTTYRTLPDVAHRAVGGMSRGGAWALHLGIYHPDLFGAIGAHSPAIFFSDSGPLPRLVLDIPPEELPHIFIDMGDGDGGLEVVEPFENFLKVHDIPHEWHEYVGYHEEKYWAAHVEEYLRWYAQNWR